MLRTLTTVLTLLMLLFSASSAFADDPKVQAQALYHELRCPICEVSLAQSDTQISTQMKDIIRQKLEAGDSPDSVKGYFVERYGESILMAPPRSGATLAAWAVPGIVIILGFGVISILVRQFRRRGDELAEPEAPLPPELEARLAAELKAFDEGSRA